VASLVYWVGFPVEIGAVVAGLSLGSSHFQLEIASKIKPLRDFFIMLFFIILGSELGFAQLKTALIPALCLALFILFIKPFILYGIFRMAHFTRRNSVFIALTAAQVSEFGFIILFMGAQMGLVGEQEVAVLTLAALITFVVSSYLITYNNKVFTWIRPFLALWGTDAHIQPEEAPQAYDVWVVGYHRLGWKICEALKEKKVSFGVVDFNPHAIEKLKHRGIPAFFGDVADVEFLELLPLDKAKLIVLTIPDHDDQLTLIEHVRRVSKKPLIVCRKAQLHANKLMKLCADSDCRWDPLL
jgi:FlaA1/EpsC-like NDP-sugar epimerase